LELERRLAEVRAEQLAEAEASIVGSHPQRQQPEDQGGQCRDEGEQIAHDQRPADEPHPPLAGLPYNEAPDGGDERQRGTGDLNEAACLPFDHLLPLLLPAAEVFDVGRDEVQPLLSVGIIGQPQGIHHLRQRDPKLHEVRVVWTWWRRLGQRRPLVLGRDIEGVGRRRWLMELRLDLGGRLGRVPDGLRRGRLGSRFYIQGGRRFRR
jgi:hypothetical protein